ncbi:ribonuclease BN [Kalymmatonema gypsitolerans NIES-4073]|nr:ribonuclease BN [Scytonema sp. NIES-4073]
MSLREIWELLRATFAEWEFKEVSLLASSLGYYTVFSLAPLLIIVIAIVGAVFGEAAVKHEIVLQVQHFVGSKAAQIIETAIANTRQPDVDQGFFGLLLNLALLVYGSSKVFVHLQRSLNRIWEVKPEPKGNFCYFIRKRFLSLTMVLVIAFLLLVSFTVNAILASAINFLSGTVPGLGYLWQIFNFLISFGAIALLFT